MAYHYIEWLDQMPCHWDGNKGISVCVCVVFVYVEKLSPYSDCAPLICFSLLRLFCASFGKCLTNFGHKTMKQETVQKKPSNNDNTEDKAFNDRTYIRLLRAIIRRFILNNVKLLHCLIAIRDQKKSTASKWIHFAVVFVTHLLIHRMSRRRRRRREKSVLWASEFALWHSALSSKII